MHTYVSKPALSPIAALERRLPVAACMVQVIVHAADERAARAALAEFGLEFYADHLDAVWSERWAVDVHALHRDERLGDDMAVFVSYQAGDDWAMPDDPKASGRYVAQARTAGFFEVLGKVEWDINNVPFLRADTSLPDGSTGAVDAIVPLLAAIHERKLNGSNPKILLSQVEAIRDAADAARTDLLRIVEDLR